MQKKQLIKSSFPNYLSFKGISCTNCPIRTTVTLVLHGSYIVFFSPIYIWEDSPFLVLLVLMTIYHLHEFFVGHVTKIFIAKVKLFLPRLYSWLSRSIIFIFFPHTAVLHPSSFEPGSLLCVAFHRCHCASKLPPTFGEAEAIPK
uniref:Uncharacterized protein n=1 Tax=Pipistrellus kuhlii TaxID=59472 RepID=A0A7J8B133_PIPKU|nr:hypothetical protein mPipKuh1_007723 [Pipistrellus kuhlii]